jgi:hypothetical protein
MKGKVKVTFKGGSTFVIGKNITSIEALRKDVKDRIHLENAGGIVFKYGGELITDFEQIEELAKNKAIKIEAEIGSSSLAEPKLKTVNP